MTLAPVDLCPGVVAFRAALFGGLNALRINDRCAWVCVPAFRLADLGAKFRVELDEPIHVTPATEVVINGCPLWEVMW